MCSALDIDGCSNGNTTPNPSLGVSGSSKLGYDTYVMSTVKKCGLLGLWYLGVMSILSIGIRDGVKYWNWRWCRILESETEFIIVMQAGAPPLYKLWFKE